MCCSVGFWHPRLVSLIRTRGGLIENTLSSALDHFLFCQVCWETLGHPTLLPFQLLRWLCPFCLDSLLNKLDYSSFTQCQGLVRSSLSRVCHCELWGGYSVLEHLVSSALWTLCAALLILQSVLPLGLCSPASCACHLQAVAIRGQKVHAPLSQEEGLPDWNLSQVVLPVEIFGCFH